MGHAECKANEIFVGNTDRGVERIEFFKAKGLNSVRLGETAYDIEGKALPAIYSPIFVSRSEADAHNNVMMTETFGPHWRRK